MGAGRDITKADESDEPTPQANPLQRDTAGAADKDTVDPSISAADFLSLPKVESVLLAQCSHAVHAVGFHAQLLSDSRMRSLTFDIELSYPYTEDGGALEGEKWKTYTIRRTFGDFQHFDRSLKRGECARNASLPQNPAAVESELTSSPSVYVWDIFAGRLEDYLRDVLHSAEKCESLSMTAVSVLQVFLSPQVRCGGVVCAQRAQARSQRSAAWAEVDHAEAERERVRAELEDLTSRLAALSAVTAETKSTMAVTASCKEHASVGRESDPGALLSGHVSNSATSVGSGTAAIAAAAAAAAVTSADSIAGTDSAHTALTHAKDGIVITNPQVKENPIIFANAGFCKLTGYSLAEILGRNCRFLQGAGTDPAAVEELRAALHSAQDATVEILNYRRDGTPFWNKLSITPVFGHDGQLRSFIGIQSDVTADRLARQVGRMLSHAFTALPAPVLVIDANGRVHHANAAACEVFERSEQALVGRSVVSFCAGGKDLAALVAALGTAPDGRESSSECACVLQGATWVACAKRIRRPDEGEAISAFERQLPRDWPAESAQRAKSHAEGVAMQPLQPASGWTPWAMDPLHGAYKHDGSPPSALGMSLLEHFMRSREEFAEEGNGSAEARLSSTTVAPAHEHLESSDLVAVRSPTSQGTRSAPMFAVVFTRDGSRAASFTASAKNLADAQALGDENRMSPLALSPVPLQRDHRFGSGNPADVPELAEVWSALAILEDGVTVADTAARRCVCVSGGFADLVGHAAEALAGTDLAVLAAPGAGVAAVEDFILGARVLNGDLAGSSGRYKEMQLASATGQPLWVRVRAVPWPPNVQHPRHVVALHRDITREKERAARARATHEALDLLGEGICIVRADNLSVFSANRVLLERMGTSLRAIEGADFSALCSTHVVLPGVPLGVLFEVVSGARPGATWDGMVRSVRGAMAPCRITVKCARRARRTALRQPAAACVFFSFGNTMPLGTPVATPHGTAPVLPPASAAAVSAPQPMSPGLAPHAMYSPASHMAMPGSLAFPAAPMNLHGPASGIFVRR